MHWYAHEFVSVSIADVCVQRWWCVHVFCSLSVSVSVFFFFFQHRILVMWKRHTFQCILCFYEGTIAIFSLILFVLSGFRKLLCILPIIIWKKPNQTEPNASVSCNFLTNERAIVIRNIQAENSILCVCGNIFQCFLFNQWNILPNKLNKNCDLQINRKASAKYINKMPSVECAICSEEFGKRTESSDVIVTPCGHVFHEICLSKWLHHR